MIVYGKNVYSTLQNDPDSIEKVYVLQGLKDAKLLKSIQKSNLKVEYCNRAKLDKIVCSVDFFCYFCKVKASFGAK